jgi:hypothetical protein
MGRVRGYRVHYQCYVANGIAGTERVSCLNSWYSKASHRAYNDGIFSPSKPSGYYMHNQFNVHQFWVLPTWCIYVSYVDLRTNIDCSPIPY